MRMPWIRSAHASVDELNEQVTAAQAALVSARAGVADAQASFDSQGSSAAAEALRLARDAERDAVEHVARASRLLAAATAPSAIAERRTRERRMTELRSLLADTIEERTLLDAEIAAWRAVVDTRVARHEHERRMLALRAELDGLTGAAPTAHLYAGPPRLDLVADALLDDARLSHADPTRQRVLQGIVLFLAPTPMHMAGGAR